MQWFSVALMAALAILLIGAAPAFYIGSVSSSIAVAGYEVVGFLLLIFAVRMGQARFPSNEFTLAERVLYETLKLTEACRLYNEALPYPGELRRKASVCRRYAAALLRNLTQFRSQPDSKTSQANERYPGPPNLFVGDLTTFADQMAPILMRIGGIINRKRQVPDAVVTQLHQLGQTLQKDWERLDDKHTAALEAIAAAVELQGVEPDAHLTATLWQITLLRTRAALGSISSAGRLIVLLAVGALGFSVFAWASAALGNPLTIQEGFQDSILVLTLVVIVWAAVRHA